MQYSPRFVKRLVLGILLAPFALIILLIVALYVPPIQRFVVGQATALLSRQLGMQVELDELHLGFPLDLSVKGFRMVQAPGDTLLSVGSLSLSPSWRSLLDERLEVPRVALERVAYQTTDSTGLTYTSVALAAAAAEGLRLDWGRQDVQLDRLLTRGGRVVYHSSDTTKSEKKPPVQWRIKAGAVSLSSTELDIRLPHDSLYLSGLVKQLSAERIQSDLERLRFEIGHAQLEAPSLRYAVDTTQARTPHFDPQHIELREALLEASSIYSEGRVLRLQLLRTAFDERSGLSLRQLSGSYRMDSLAMQLEDLELRTSESHIQGQLSMPWSLLERDKRAALDLDLKASLGTADILNLSGQALEQVETETQLVGRMRHRQLLAPLKLDLALKGTLSELQTRLELSWPDVLRLSLGGPLYALTDDAQRSGRLQLETELGAKATSLLSLVSPELTREYRLPKGLSLKGQVKIKRGDYALQLQLKEGTGGAQLEASYLDRAKRYEAKLRTTRLDLAHFAPKLGLGAMSLELAAQGQGFDILSPHTWTKVTGRLEALDYGTLPLHDVTLDADLKGGYLGLALNSANRGANFSLLLDGILSRKGITTALALDLFDLDLQRLGLSETGLSGRLRLEGELRSDLKETHDLTASIDSAVLVFQGDTLQPPRFDLLVSTNAHSILGNVSSGDMKGQLQLSAGPTELQKSLGKLLDQATAQWQLIASGKSARRQLEDLVPLLPSAQLSLTMGNNNPLRYYLANQQIALGELSASWHTDPDKGISGSMHISDLRIDTLRLKEVHLAVETERTARPAQPDSLTLHLKGMVNKQRFRTQAGFNIEAQLQTTLQAGALGFAWRDESGTLVHGTHLSGVWGGDAYQLRFDQERLRIAYKDFSINPDNHLSLRKRDYLLLGSLRLQGAERGLLSLEAKDEPLGTQDVMLSIQNLYLEDFRALGLPDVAGVFFGDIHYQRQGKLSAQPTISGDLSLTNFRYEDKKLGHFTTSLFYEPRTDDSHYITADVGYNGRSAMSIDGIYYPKRRVSPLSGTLQLNSFPLELANPFLIASGSSIEGAAEGSVRLSGSLTEPILSGQVALSKTLLHLSTYGMHLQLDSIPVRLEGSTMHFDHYAIHPSVDPKKAIYIDGKIEQSTSPKAKASLRITSDELTLLNDPRPKREDQLLYGRIVASTDMRVTGPMTGLRVRGALNVLSGTNCTYIMREDPLETSQGTNGLVSFVDFADTLFTKRVEPISPSFGGLDVNLSIHIDPSVRVGADLTADGQDYAHAQGGGTLHFTYPPFGQMSLRGRYEMSGGGDLSYTLPVVGNKKFSIDPTSTLSWNGPVSNPYLNFSATQSVKATVNESGSSAQRVTFNVSIKVSDYVNRMNLSFGLSAPDNLSMQNSLATMTTEEQGKQAIALMATGVYLGSGSGTGNLDLNNALTSLLQSQINKTAGKLLQGTDLSLGVDRYDGSSGEAARTDYTYSFSRRFYNDRIRIVVGGKVQSGANSSNQGQNFLDNVSLQYQLDKSGEQYFSLYHKRVTDNILEGEYSETGVGYVLRRKLYSLWDLFRPKAKTKAGQQKAQPLFFTPGVYDSTPSSTRSQTSADTLRHDSVPLIRRTQGAHSSSTH